MPAGRQERYDYIVVGGGSAGCVTANRLVQEHGARVLLLEAGPADDSHLIHMPAGFVRMLFKPSPYVSIHVSESQSSLDGTTVAVFQGNVLGGGSSVNAMTYTRGVPADYAKWDAMTGGAGWAWENLLPHFRRQEGNQRFNDAAHGVDGPLKVSDAHHPICDASRAFLHALQERGLPYVADVNAGSEYGVSLIQSTTYKGKRCSAATAFLVPIKNDPRLTLKVMARVTQILMEGLRANGVAFVQGSSSAVEFAYADREVILTAGAYISPKLLMLSGIGPAAHLAEHGIPVRVDLPGVGQNMQDHNSVSLTARTHGQYGYTGEDHGIRMVKNGLQYLLFGSGPVASTSSEVMAFLDPEGDGPEPTIQLYCVPVMEPNPAVSFEPGWGITLMANLIAPRSRGSMRLRSANPADMPIISPNYLSDPDDLRTIVAGLRYLRMITETKPLSRMITAVTAPAPEMASDQELAAYCKKVTRTNFHPVGSCRMGPDSDPMAVLTPDLKVRGVEGLRVFDASMMPSIISANTNAPVMAIADRAVEMMMTARPEGPQSRSA